jgi:transcriptional regulator with XRE-family HTH domain
MRNTEVKYPNRLRELREARGWKQIEVALLLGFKCEDRISRWEHGTMVPHLTNLLKLTYLFNTSLEDIYPPNKSDKH